MLQKQGINIPFGMGIDTKTDPNQVVAGKMLGLENVVFQSGGLLSKANGFGTLTTLPNVTSTSLATLNGNLLATGSTLESYVQENNQWYSKGTLTPVDVSVQSIVRSSTQQTQQDAAISASGLGCFVYIDSGLAYYQIVDTLTGGSVIPRTGLPSTAILPRAFVLNNFFIITYITTSHTLGFISIPMSNLSTPSSPTTIASTLSASTNSYDGIVTNGRLFLAWNANDGGGAVRLTYLDTRFTINSQVVIAGKTASLMSMTADTTGSTPVVYCTFWDTSVLWTASFNQILSGILSITSLGSVASLNRLTSGASHGVMTFFYETTSNYPYIHSGATIRSDFVSKGSVTATGSVTSPTVFLRSVGLGSKAFTASDQNVYVLLVYAGSLQPSYFLVDSVGNVVSRLAYQNAGGYPGSQVLPTVSVNNDVSQVPYLIKDLITSVNKTTAAANVAGIYTQTGINLASFRINIQPQYLAETASVLHLTGGELWMYDGLKAVEHGFHVWPEDIQVTASSGGNLKDQQYYYVATYEWTDNQGNIHRSAPSVPVGVLIATGSNSGEALVEIPTLRLTGKITPNPVRIVLYRWSTAQQNYFQVTSITSPLINSTTTDLVQYTDDAADATILGNALIYTTGGVLENTAAPPSSAVTLWKNRLWLINGEDRNSIWFSKPVVENVPVEMSSLQSVFVPPTAGAQGATGPCTAISGMDDKLIIFKKDSIYYQTGNGPDVTGANDDYNVPVYISASVGCSNPSSIVLTPNGLMFQSDKGIWLLSRDLGTTYIGADVEGFNSLDVTSAIAIPGTNEVRFTLSDGTMLAYDYFYQQWDTRTSIGSISSVLYKGLQTSLNEFGVVSQETPGGYLNGSTPVLMKFTTAWIKVTNLQGFQRAYFLYLLSNYLTPHKLNIEIAYDYNPAPQQTVLITPDNFSNPYGVDSPYGGGPATYGGPGVVEQWRIFLSRQKCEAIQVTVSEVFDPTLGTVAGAGLTMSGLNLVFGAKKGYPVRPAKNSAG